MTLRLPIFVIGTPRSGTTLTARILGRHSRLFFPGETHFFDDIYARRNEYGYDFSPASKQNIFQRLSTLYGRYNEPEDQKRIDRLLRQMDYEKLTKNWTSYKDVLDSFMNLQVRYAGKIRWGNHTPRDIFNLENILFFYPQAKIIICTRDLRDFMVSYKGKWRATVSEEVERLKKLYHPVVTSLLWKSSVHIIKKAKEKVDKKNLCIVKYEDLVQKTEDTVHQICRTIEEDFEDGMLKVESYASSHGIRQKGVHASSVGMWKDKLKPEEIWIGQRMAFRELNVLGYNIVQISINPLKVLITYISAPFALWRGLKANKHKRGPLLPYLAKRIHSFIGERT